MDALTVISVDDMAELLGLGSLGAESVTHLSVPLHEEIDTAEKLQSSLELESLEHIRFEEEMREWAEKNNTDRQITKQKLEAYISGFLAGYINQAETMLVAARNELKQYVELHRNVLMNSAIGYWGLSNKYKVECSMTLNYVFSCELPFYNFYFI